MEDFQEQQEAAADMDKDRSDVKMLKQENAGKLAGNIASLITFGQL